MTQRWIGTLGVRLATIAFAVASSMAIGLGALFPDVSGVLFVAGCALGLLALLGLVYSTRSGYTRWMKGAAALNTVMPVVLFGVFYLVFVPFFVVFVKRSDPLRLRKTGAGRLPPPPQYSRCRTPNRHLRG